MRDKLSWRAALEKRMRLLGKAGAMRVGLSGVAVGQVLLLLLVLGWCLWRAAAS